jgi:hypothetical protein
MPQQGSFLGLSSWPCEHTQAAATADEAAFGVVRNVILHDGVPREPTVLNSALIGLQKPGACGAGKSGLVRFGTA